METKYCPRCFLTLPVASEFKKDSKETDGYSKYCKECKGRSESTHKKKIDTDPKFNEISYRI